MRYKFVQDDDCHWYMIPPEREKEFDEWVINTLTREVCTKEELEKLGINPFISFEGFRIDGPHRYTFENPQEQ